MQTCCLPVGAYDGEVPPVPIPNTVVKLTRADNTWREAAREDKSVPTLRPFFMKVNDGLLILRPHRPSGISPKGEARNRVRF